MLIKSTTGLFSKSIFVSMAIIFLSSCGSESSENMEDDKDTTMTDTLQVEKKGPNVFYSVPSPIQLGKLLKRAGAQYDKNVLNSTNNVSSYSTNMAKALNLGVYGADMSYSAIFGQTQETMSYLDCAKKLADDLGSSGAFAGETIARLKKHSSNNDSLLFMISEIFLNSNEAFKESEQGNIALLAISGGFIEGLYVGTQVAKSLKDNSDVIIRIAELKGSINNLVALMNTQENDPDIAPLLNDMKEIKAVYDEMQMDQSSPSVTADSTKNVITIGGSAKYNLTKEQLEKITTKVEALRNKIVTP